MTTDYHIISTSVFERQYLQSELQEFLRIKLDFVKPTLLMFNPEEEGYVSLKVLEIREVEGKDKPWTRRAWRARHYGRTQT